jgi:hypothetical protein
VQNEKLSTWYRNNQKDNRSRTSVILKLIDAFIASRIMRPPRKRRVLDEYSDILCDDEWKGRFNRWFKSTGFDEKERLKNYTELIKAHWYNEDEAFREELTVQVEMEHQQALIRWDNELKSAKSLSTDE